jgi:hypothetical protein
MADRAGAKDMENTMGLRREVWRFWSERIGRLGRCRVLHFRREESVISQERAERNSPEPTPHVGEKPATIEQVSSNQERVS